MHKIFSYLFLCAGVLIILFALHNTYQVLFTDQSAPVILQISDVEIQTKVGPFELPASSLNNVANLILFLLFMFFVVFVGGKIAEIGCHLLKNERIHDAILLLNKIPPTEVLKKL